MRHTEPWSRALILLNVALLAGMALLAAAMFRRGATPVTVTDPRPAPAPEPEVVRGEESLDAARLRRLFRESDVGSHPAPAPAGPAHGAVNEAAKLPGDGFELLGTVCGRPALARAVIADRRRRVQEIYRIGDVVAGHRLTEVGRDFVSLEKGGRKVRLEMQVATRGPADDSGVAMSADLSPAPQARGAIVRALAPDSLEVDRQAFRRRVGGIDTLIRRAELTPRLENGEMAGIRLAGLERVRFARFLGLQEGDVLQEVNGQRLTSMQKALQVMRKARAQRNLRISLLRDGEVKNLRYGLR